MTVNVDKKKVLDLLRCSLNFELALTDLFLGKKPLIQRQYCLSPCEIRKNSSSIQIKVKLCIRKYDRKVMYAQGDGDFADFLFSFLTFPLGGVLGVLGGNCSPGSIDGLYKSIAALNENKFFMSHEAKCRVVDPCIASQFKLENQILPISEQGASSYSYYRHSFYKEMMPMNESSHYRTSLKLVDPISSKESDEGYVKGQSAFIVTDDLAISPMSLISAVSLLSHLGTSPSDVIGKVVTIGLNEGLSILKAALTSTAALTNGLRHLLTQVKQENI